MPIMFELIKSIKVSDGKIDRRISIYHGDLSKIPAEHAVDLLVISAFPNAYWPTATSLIGALDRSGVSVMRLSRSKLHDLRSSCFFWISKPLNERHPNANFKQLACFESNYKNSPSQLVGDLFRGLFPFLSVTRETSVAMPILAAGDQGYSKSEMFDAIVKGASLWMKRGLGISELKIVELNRSIAVELSSRLVDVVPLRIDSATSERGFDVFLSFSSKDEDAADVARSALLKRADIDTVFDFRSCVDPGVAWQDRLDQAISTCRTVVAILTPDYFVSAECKEELAQARLRHKRERERVLLPVLWRSVDNVALWLQTLNLLDCRESNVGRLSESLARHDFR